MRAVRVGRLAAVGVMAGLIVLGGVGPAVSQGDKGAQAAAPAVDPRQVERIVGPLHTTVDKVLAGVPNRACVDAPLLGNGGLGAVITGKPEAWPLQFWVMKSNFCKLRHDHRKGGPRPFGWLDINVPALKGSTWQIQQHIYPAITQGKFTKDNLSLSLRTYVAATDDVLVIELTAEGGPLEAQCKLTPATGRGSTEEIGATGGIQWARRIFHKDRPAGGTHPAEIPTTAGAAVRVLDGKSLKLEPGKPVTIVLALQSNFDAADPLAAAQKKAADLTPAKLAQLEQAHRQWWRDFWGKSLVEFDEPRLPMAYYMAHYQQGAGMRDKDFPPGLFGLWVTHDDPCWAGDYHLNFDYESQYYSLYKSNRIQQADTYEQPILEFIERGKWYAKECRGLRGVYYPVGIFAKGMETSRQPGMRDSTSVEKGGVFLGQKTNAAYALAPMAMRWWHTYDLDYARRVWPFVIEVANFWEDYLRFVDGRYVVYGDSIQEDIHTGGSGDMNSVLSLGLVDNCFRVALDMSKELGLAADRREKWEHILKHLSKLPTFPKDGKTVFRYTEKGTEWVVDNSVGVQHIYPGGLVGLDDKELAEIGRNTVAVKNRWNCDNGTNSMYPAAVRVGYDPDDLLKKLDNLFFANSARTDSQLPRSLEEGSTVPNTINEMLCMSHRQVLRVFAVWPKGKFARFWNLRAEGAFLVSSELKGGEVQYLRIHSEKGRDCTFVNPWPGRGVDVYRDGQKLETLKGERITIKTTPGDTVVLAQEGKGLPKIE